MAKDPAQVAQTWASRLGAADAEIRAGVSRVTQAPGEAAAQQADAWIAGIQRSRDKWARNVSAVTLSQWQNAMITKGLPRIAQGAQQAIPKVQQFMTQFLPYVEQGAATVRQMPKGTVEQGIARAAAMIRHNAGFVRNPYTGQL